MFTFSGIYKITQKNTSKVYIGISTTDIARRWGEHISHLLNNRHENTELQSDFNIYGLDSITFEILEFLPFFGRIDLYRRESYWIDKLNKQGYKTYNLQVQKFEPETLNKNCILCERKSFRDSLCQEHLYRARKSNIIQP